MNINDFEPAAQRSYNSGGSWENFTLGDEKRARGRFSKFFLALSAYIIIAYSLVALATILIDRLELSDNPFINSVECTILVNVVTMYIIAFPLFVLFTLKMQSATRYKTKVNIKELVMLFFVAYALLMAGSLIGTFVTEAIGTLTGNAVNDETAELISEMPIWLTILVPVLIGPIIEELMFRKLLMDKLGIYGDRLAIIVSAVAFGLFHGNLSQLFYATLLGVVLGYIYAKTANVVYPIIVHMLINFFGSVLPMFFMDSIETYLSLLEEISAGATVDMELYSRVEMIAGIYSTIVMLLVGIGAVIIFKYKKRFFLSDRCEIEIPKQKRASVVLLNAGSIVFILLTLATIVLDIIL